jgi:hypothetical protein
MFTESLKLLHGALSIQAAPFLAPTCRPVQVHMPVFGSVESVAGILDLSGAICVQEMRALGVD